MTMLENIDATFNHINLHLTSTLHEFIEYPSQPLLIALGVVLLSPLVYTLLSLIGFGLVWVFWLSVSLLFGIVQSIYVLFQFILIFSDISLLSSLKATRLIITHAARLNPFRLVTNFSPEISKRRKWRYKVDSCGGWGEYVKVVKQEGLGDMEYKPEGDKRGRLGRRSLSSRALKEEAAEVEGSVPVPSFSRSRSSSDLQTLPDLLNKVRTATLQIGSASALEHPLTSMLKGRNYIGIDDVMGDVARLRDMGLPYEDKKLVHEIRRLTHTIDSRLHHITSTTPLASKKSLLGKILKLKHSVGNSALMLSGGGSITMYHLGTIRALIESGVYKNVSVVSGTSGGSIAAAMTACKSEAELLEHICVSNISTDYMSNGEQGKRGIRWFPKLFKMGVTWVKEGVLVTSEEFRRCCYFYYGDMTFEEAYAKTKKHVCITVSASRAQSDGSGTQRLLLNHISTPHVTVASAVAASCALPGVMKPAKLDIKVDGTVKLFEVDGVEWIDGSVQADIPFKRIGTLFNVTNFIVCQCNFHVVPFLNKAHNPTKKSWYWRVFQTLEWDIRNRVLNLSRLGLFPKLFGQDISKVFKQKYHGHVTIVPRMNMMQVIGVKALLNPTVEDMEHYLKNGQQAAFPYIDFIKHLLSVETSIASCVANLERDLKITRSSAGEGVGGIAMYVTTEFESRRGGRSASRSASRGREFELLQIKMDKLKEENEALKAYIVTLEKKLSNHNNTQNSTQNSAISAIEVVVQEDGAAEDEGESEGNFIEEGLQKAPDAPDALNAQPSLSPGWTTVRKKGGHKKQPAPTPLSI